MKTKLVTVLGALALTALVAGCANDEATTCDNDKACTENSSASCCSGSKSAATCTKDGAKAKDATTNKQ